ncbi:hypothetical protein C5167_028192 [Papaver somniferum]|uniref:sugar transport protein 5-like n=1 Tax=Papaver somniferum TaxID=3469 RepID=UPI000E703B81|nr:sugar transport protein 5-like [Papaver somniferum]XP_026434251.1 sugar transport protein 5-like [Papaver somniferum]RZC87738.1 hypothetical protein C5167_028192 [Papaver somniferum]
MEGRVGHGTRTAGYGAIDPSIRNEKITWSVIMSSIVAASCGLIFGYDLGISGGVTTMPPFLEKFFPSVLKKKEDATQSTYCVYDSQILTLFTSSLYLSGLVSSLLASRVTKVFGRKFAILFGGCTFLVGSIVNCTAPNVVLLILGRILLGFGVGFTNQAAPVYIAEMAPPKYRGAFNTGFQLFIAIGVLCANIINFVTSGLGKWGWRLSLGLAAAPAAIVLLGALLVTDTPSSLVERGKLPEARDALLKVRGANSDIEAELSELVEACETAREVDQISFKTIFKKQYRPHLVIAGGVPFFQQLTGINTIAFYAPVLFNSVGFGNDSALKGTILLGLVNVGSIAASMFMVDRFGRRALFIEGGIQMFICQVGLASILGATLGLSGKGEISKAAGSVILVLMCLYAAGFGWSWGPLCFLVPTEVCPVKIRPIGQSVSIAVHFSVAFILSQTFLSQLCHFKYTVFLFYAGWIVIMTTFVVCLLPETKGVPLESMHTIWQQHWLWKKFTAPSPTMLQTIST